MLLFSNSLSGTVSAISIPGLNALTLHGNRFEGDAPDLSSLGSLRYLTLFENEFTGTHTHICICMVDICTHTVHRYAATVHSSVS